MMNDVTLIPAIKENVQMPINILTVSIILLIFFLFYFVVQKK